MSIQINNSSFLGQTTDESASPLKTEGKSALNKDDFLKLLVEQLRHQDPLSPMDNQEFVAQMSQFSSLEQQIQMNQNIQMLQVAQLSQNNAQAINLVGKTITASGDTFKLGNDNADLSYKLDADAENIKISIKDQYGQVVRTIDRGKTFAGVNEFSWDGKDNDGNQLPPGNYSFSVEAYDKAGNQLNATTFIKGVVSKVSFDKGYPELLVNGRSVKMGDIISIEDTSSDTEQINKFISNLKINETYTAQ